MSEYKYTHANLYRAIKYHMGGFWKATAYDDLMDWDKEQILAAIVNDMADEPTELVSCPSRLAQNFLTDQLHSLFANEEYSDVLTLKLAFRKVIESNFKEIIEKAFIEALEDEQAEREAEKLEHQSWYARSITHLKELEQSDNRERLRGVRG